MNSLGRALLLTTSVAFLAPLAAASCTSIGQIDDRPRGGSGAAGTGVQSTGTPGSAGSGFSDTGSGTANMGGSATGTAGTSETGSGTAGASSGTGTAGTGTTAGTAGAMTTGAAGATATGTAGSGGLPHCKRGEAYQSNSLADLTTLSKGISWWYNWSTSPDKGVATTFAQTGVEFVPMVWGQQGGPPDPATIEKQIPKGSKYILGFNEPNFASQANITATQAAALWPRIMQIAKDLNLKIGSPAPNYCAGACNDTDPIHYLDAFFAACTGCQVDFIAAHWYACDGPALTHYLGLLKKYNKPIWLTEFSCMDAGDHSVAGEETYMKTALQILENDPMIFRYSWFTGRWTNPAGISLLAGDGQLTELGNQYVSTPATATCGQ